MLLLLCWRRLLVSKKEGIQSDCEWIGCMLHVATTLLWVIYVYSCCNVVVVRLYDCLVSCLLIFVFVLNYKLDNFFIIFLIFQFFFFVLLRFY